MLGSDAAVAIVGAGAAGVSAAEALRLEGYAGRIRLIGDENLPPYDRPPLSKQVLSGQWSFDQTYLRPRERYEAQGIDLVLSRAAVSLDAGRRRLEFDDGSSEEYDGIVLATGMTPRQLPFGRELDGVQVLRTAGDLELLADRLARAESVVVIGAGFLGAEAAATARSLGRATALVDPLPLPMTRQVGSRIASRIARLHLDHGIDLRVGCGVAAFSEDGGAVRGVVLDNGVELPADLVIVAIGAQPVTGWLEGSGLTLDNGIVCDETCRAAPGIYAAGDVARWVNPRYGMSMRLEHRLNATEQGARVAFNLVHDEPRAYDPIPYFWSDQYDVKIHGHGLFPEEAKIEVAEGDLDGDRFVVTYRLDGVYVGVLGWNLPKATRQLRQALLEAPAAVAT